MAQPKTGFTNDTASAGQSIANNALAQTAGLLSTKPNAKYASGPRCTLKVNNQLMGFAFNVTYTITTDNIEIKTIDDYNAYELAPNRISIEGTLGAFHIPGEGASALLTQANVLSFLFHKYITIEIRDSATDNLLFLTNRAVITSRTEELTAERLGQVTLRWKAIGWEDEITPAYPVNYNSSPTAERSAISRLVAVPGKIASKVF